MYRTAGWILLVALLAGAGCGGEVVGGGFDGNVRAMATGDGTPPPSAALMPAGEAGMELDLPSSTVAPRGTLSFSAQVRLVSETGVEFPLSAAPHAAAVRIEGGDSAVVGERSLRPGRYTQVRVIFPRVSADVTGGLLVGGVSLRGPISVALAAGEHVVVQRTIDLTVEPHSSHTLIIDLRASLWLAAADPLTGTVPATVFRDAVEVRVQ